MLVGARRLGGRKGKNRLRNLKVRKNLLKSGKQRNQKRNQRVRVIQRMKERREKNGKDKEREGFSCQQEKISG